MKFILSVASLLIATLAGAAPPAAVDSAESAKARDLVVQLGSSKYREREKAAADLVRMGRAAKQALQDGKNHPDPEISGRSQQLLPQALALDLAYRIDRFIKDKEGKQEHDLPLLKTFREKIGKDENASKLFANMLQANGGLLESAEDEPTKLTELVQRRTNEMYYEMFGNPFAGGFRGGNFQPNLLNAHDLCCVLFASSLPAYKPAQPDYMLSNLYMQPNFANLLKDEKTGSAYRKLFFTYLDSHMDDNTINQCVYMLGQNRIKEGADVIAKAIKDGKTTQPYTKANAMCCVGTLGTKDHIPVFANMLKDDTQVQPFFGGRVQRGAIKVKDVALAMSIHLSGKNPKDYGFTMWQVYPNNLIQYHQLGFATDEERDSAFKKWETDSKKADAEPKKPAEKTPPPKK